MPHSKRQALAFAPLESRWRGSCCSCRRVLLCSSSRRRRALRPWVRQRWRGAASSEGASAETTSPGASCSAPAHQRISGRARRRRTAGRPASGTPSRTPPEDVKLMKETGLDAFRFSISWPRLIPNGRGEVNPKGLEYYNNLINELLGHGIEPHATLFQYDLPQVLEDEYNGWLSPQIIDDFTAYSDVCFREFGDRVTNWTTLNEPNAAALLGYDIGHAPPGRCSEPFGNCPNGNSVTEPYIEKQHGVIGINIFIYDFVPLTNSTEDTTATERAMAFYTGWFLDPLYHGDYPDVMKKNAGSKLPKFSNNQSEQLINSIDFLGVNYYSIMYVKDDPQAASSNERDFLADICVKTTYTNNSTIRGVHEYFKQYYGNPPIYIHENGYPMNQDVIFDDGPRVEFLSEHLTSLADSVRNGSNTKGYFVWSLMDLYELLGDSTYGLYYVDFADKELRRYPRRSAIWYADFLKGRRAAMPGRSSDSSLAAGSGQAIFRFLGGSGQGFRQHW